MDASAPPCPTAARAIPGASIATATACALPHTADARAILDTNSVGATTTGPPHPRARELRHGHRDGVRASSAPGNCDSAQTSSPRPRS